MNPFDFSYTLHEYSVNRVLTGWQTFRFVLRNDASGTPATHGFSAYIYDSSGNIQQYVLSPTVSNAASGLTDNAFGYFANGADMSYLKGAFHYI